MEKYHQLTLCLWVFVILCNHNKCFGCLEKERIALLELKNEFFKISRMEKNGFSFYSFHPLLSTWDDENENDCCAWERVQCNKTTRQVIQLSLSHTILLEESTFGDAYLNASLFLPFEELQHLDLSANSLTSLEGLDRLSKLKMLQHLDLSWNSLTNLEGLDRLSKLKMLQHLDLSANSLTNLEGLDSLSKLKKLHFLDISSNDLNISSILPSVGALTSLKTLDLSAFRYGSLTQGFDVLLKLQKLEELSIRWNKLNNSILPLLGELKSLKMLDLRGNHLEGSLSEFQDWKNTSNLKVLYLGGNYFPQGIPSSISTLDSLQALSLQYSNLNGSISGLCELKNLRDLDLSENNFEGIIPPCFNNLTSLTMVDFSSNRLYGKIPSFLTSNLKSLEFLSLRGNQFDGLHSTSPLSNQLKVLDMSNCNLNISTTDLLRFLHNQYNLRYLDLSHNNLHGRFPNWLVKNNTRLEIFSVNNNSLTGHIQLGFVPLSKLTIFDVSKNLIQGKLQTDIGVVLSKLNYLNVSANNIEGTMPTSLGNLRQLYYLDLSSNKFSGEMPKSWDLSNFNFVIVILSNNRLHGQISPILFNITSLYSLRLNNNQFTGNIPNHIAIPPILSVFDISQNHISGRIPSWIGKLSWLQTLILGKNSFHGSLPLELCNLNNIEFFDLSHNNVSGSLPSCLNLTSLKYMHLQGNQFTGTIPKALLQSSNLITLDLKHNNLSGSIPNWFGLLRNLRVLLLKGNHLSGSIIHQLCQLKNISLLDLSDNTFSGSIPLCLSNISFGKIGHAEPAFEIEEYAGSGAYTFHYEDLIPMRDLSGLSSIQLTIYSEQEEVEFLTKSRSDTYKGDILKFMSGIDLSCNQLTGPIPAEIGTLNTVMALNLSHNHLTGSIPRTFANLKHVESMDLSYNKLTGEIPSELTDLSFLGVFDVSYNNLSGKVPYRGHLSTFDESRYRGNPSLCGPPLQKPCKTIKDPTTTTTPIGSSASSGMDLISLFASFGASYIMTLGGFVTVLYINPYWRHMWFNFIDACLSFMFPFWSEAIYKVDNP